MSESQKKPLVTFALFAYNQEPYICQAIEAAFAQTYSPLEIILTDDHSSDATFSKMEVAAAGYSGPHTVRLNRNSTRLGVAGHVNKIEEMALGDLIIAAAGDDISYPHRVATMVDTWIAADRFSGMLHSAYDDMDINGEIKKTISLESITTIKSMITSNVIVGATEAWSRHLFEVFGPLNSSVTHEDRVMGTRAALLGGIRYIDKPLVAYRRGGISSQGKQISEFEVRRLGARRYVADMAQMICDFEIARRKKIIDNDLCDDLMSIAQNRLARELLLASTTPIKSVMKLIFLEFPRLVRRIALVTYRAIR